MSQAKAPTPSSWARYCPQPTGPQLIPNSVWPRGAWMSGSLRVSGPGLVAGLWTPAWLPLYSCLLCAVSQWRLDAWELGKHNFSFPHLRLRLPTLWAVSQHFPKAQHLTAVQGKHSVAPWQRGRMQPHGFCLRVFYINRKAEWWRPLPCGLRKPMRLYAWGKMPSLCTWEWASAQPKPHFPHSNGNVLASGVEKCLNRYLKVWK